MNEPTVVNGRVIFASTTVPEPGANEYNRWISTGHDYGAPHYSIQRFTYGRPNGSRSRTVPTDPYYVAYTQGFRISDREYATFDEVCESVDEHYARNSDAFTQEYGT